MRQRPLFKWLLLALPSCYFTIPSEKQRGISTLLVNNMTYLLPYILSGSQFVSGGMVCQHVYGKKWRSDIDIYINCEYIEGRRYTYQGNLLDIHVTDTQNLERVIENFDLSIVQQGILGGDYFLTPLAFYTQCWHEIVVIPNESNIQYTIPKLDDNNGPSIENRTLWQYINLHRELHEQNNCAYHKCEKCARVQWMPELIMWKERVRRYNERFKSFSIVYCKSPLVSK